MIVLLFAPLFAEAAGAPRTFKELSSQLVTILSAGVVTLVALAIVIYIWGIASNMIKLGEGEGDKYKAYIFWGIAILFVMVSIWGIIGLLNNTIFSGNPAGSDSSGYPSTPSFTNVGNPR